MTAKDQLSELKMGLHDKTLDLKQDLDELKDTYQSVTANMKELKNENGYLQEEARSLFDKVNSNDFSTCSTN